MPRRAASPLPLCPFCHSAAYAIQGHWWRCAACGATGPVRPGRPRRRWNWRRFIGNTAPLALAAAIADAVGLGWLWRWGLWR
jgi:hypothetical protein